ncbi:phosphatidylethanolamine/phosphatidyl-N-methylethanolamine N-methyltransferase/demethylmenaquinone methyltransferase/2-methoxy-6-polyprenyl-1,4-benzoquinol methylase [Gillisia sp. Hel_I_86]|uniref:class I SAM-dependent methyltransferase n=1 Tax=Gillisia sp. Hel_I_86 TaxID=1249981 RepID=UPI00119AE363|nr:methyltransferase domain-containing protein [Gillisia sp. Hel_I_86]TVZ26081.1 phosphatidylethanolamine/phosphatidyl-N-methylethanolamine N-methyltransferase/demethylmenaquinone methyltransferase/2-methoxy-6-polyprenyl-1,4-benzoquinol methylase [Gillisia sp. Hel_I_86]
METQMYGTKEEQENAIRYYDKLSVIYDYISNWYYKKARNYAIKELQLKNGQTVLNVPCGTGVNFKYFNEYLNNSGLIIGIDLSSGMLDKARQKIEKNGWTNIETELNDATKIDQNWLDYRDEQITVDAVFCDLGLSGLPEWRNIIDNMISILKPNGRIVILDWYLEKPSLKGDFVKWIGKGEVDRPIYQYLEMKVSNFKVDDSFNYGGIFVASGSKPE